MVGGGAVGSLAELRSLSAGRAASRQREPVSRRALTIGEPRRNREGGTLDRK